MKYVLAWAAGCEIQQEAVDDGQDVMGSIFPDVEIHEVQIIGSNVLVIGQYRPHGIVLRCKVLIGDDLTSMSHLFAWMCDDKTFAEEATDS